MYVRKFNFVGIVRRAGYFGLSMLCGCGTFLIPAGTGNQPTTLNLTTLDIDPSSVHYESDTNGQFISADLIALQKKVLAIQGEISDSEDVDIYNLGPVKAGDRIVVELTASDSLRGAIALFDEFESLLLVNDHRNVYLGKRKPFVDVIIRRPADECYLALSSTPGFASSGAYTMVAAKQSSIVIPDARPDTILLDFAGAQSVRIGSRPAIDVPRFNASAISEKYTGFTNSMITRIVEAVREDFAGLNGSVLTTSEGAVYDGNMTRIFFGTYNEALLGVAEGVDEFNSDLDQVAIVFTETFSAFMRADPTLQQMSQSIANVASHEIGHLLGLIHTQDNNGIMDVTASVRRLLEDQSFRKSPIYSLVYPVGNQNTVQTLLDTLGGDETLLLSRNQPVVLREYETADDEVPARSHLILSTCGLDEH